MKKIFILTGEPSGDKLAAKVISKLKIKDPSITYLCLGGEELKSLGINSISKLSEVTYLGFTRVLLNLFTTKRFPGFSVIKILVSSMKDKLHGLFNPSNILISFISDEYE